MYTTLATNGATLSTKVLNELVDAGLGGLQISLDTANPDTFGRMTRAPWAYPLVIKATEEAACSEIRVSVKAVLTKQNIGEVGDFIDRCASMGVSAIKLQNFEPGLAGRGDSTLFISERDVENLRTLVEAKRRVLGQQLKIMLILTGEHWKPGEFRACRHALSGFGVLSNGDVTLCDRFGHSRKMIIGNVRRLSLDRIWRSKHHLRIVKPDKDKASETCSSCSHFAECRTGCFLYSLYATGMIYATDPRCPLIRPQVGEGRAIYADKIVLGGRYLFCSRS
jgi:radical SAM protein with 4Fe4S-binding SPASM domain